uniref:Uncharacterized protein n=1 Tax=Monodelphis domestica TaxID=13616 RepID=A0A5F8GCB7_MONDO
MILEGPPHSEGFVHAFQSLYYRTRKRAQVGQGSGSQEVPHLSGAGTVIPEKPGIDLPCLRRLGLGVAAESIMHEDYKLLENMNKLTSLKYLEMKDTAVNISGDLKPYLDQIALIEGQGVALKQAVYMFDAYSKKLEAKQYKNMETRDGVL